MVLGTILASLALRQCYRHDEQLISTDVNRDPLVQRFAYDGVERGTDLTAAEASLFCFQYNQRFSNQKNQAERCYRPMNRYFLLHLVLNRSAYIWKIKTTLVNQSYVRTMKRPLSNKTSIEAFGKNHCFCKINFQIIKNDMVIDNTAARYDLKLNPSLNLCIRIPFKFPVQRINSHFSPFPRSRWRSSITTYKSSIKISKSRPCRCGV